MSNRLSQESSPYLLQHADNPVDWYPWGDEALTRAKAEDKPILLSVGYSTCHWCHVMAHESFENEETAALMNRDFVNIKLDREERPDLDDMYMKALQGLGDGHGGWPMTVFCTPDGRPFFAGTYFPPESRHGLPSFQMVLAHITRLWTTHRNRIFETADSVVDMLERSGRPTFPAPDVGTSWLNQAVEQSLRRFDKRNGGFGGKPKFPPHGELLAFGPLASRVGMDHPVCQMLDTTLDQMARGGMYDVIGGGFSRYSVDASWIIPHFEKMLYDNALLLWAYTDGFKRTKRPAWRRVVEETATFLMREMTLSGGAFAAAYDADSEHEEGKFYVWTPAQLSEILGPSRGPRACALLGITEHGNFEHGTSAARTQVPAGDLPEADRLFLDEVIPILYQIRQARVPPGRDDKVLLSWNGLAISALARAGFTFDRPDWVAAAASAFAFIDAHLRVPSGESDGERRLNNDFDNCRPSAARMGAERGQLLRVWCDGRLGKAVFADDLASWGNAAFDLYEATGDQKYLEEARLVATTAWDECWDGETLCQVPRHQAAHLIRAAAPMFGAEPSAWGLLPLLYARLDLHEDAGPWGGRADLLLSKLHSGLGAGALGMALLAGIYRSGQALEVVVVGEPSDPRTAALLAVVRTFSWPIRVVAAAAPGTTNAKSSLLAHRLDVAQPTAWVCQQNTCLLPVHEPKALVTALHQALGDGP